MSDTPKPADPRAERLKAALRDNLRRRKAQSRERGRTDPAGASPEEPGSPDIAPASDPRPPEEPA